MECEVERLARDFFDGGKVNTGGWMSADMAFCSLCREEVLDVPPIVAQAGYIAIFSLGLRVSMDIFDDQSLDSITLEFKGWTGRAFIR